ncbi:MAG: proline--tRNA ligase [Halanaerobiales bacterium]|nr:proline--tRNA ligase [Halanaerobiales bacterium]
MRMSKLYLPTLKEDPAEADIKSHQLMLRAGMMRKLSPGIFSYLPLGYRVIRKIENIVREEMNKTSSQEVLLPVMQSSKIWKESNRWDKFGPLMIKFKDRKDHEYCLGPTHEEVITDLIKDEVRSYKDLPLNLYQIQTKVRDEIRPRFGVMRGREFIMKDAYSMDIDYEGLDNSYQEMYDAYVNIFDRLGLETRVVKADSGAMGGKDSHEFMVIAESGEDDIAVCDSCDYAANTELASSYQEKEIIDKDLKERKLIDTPDIKTIEGLEQFLKIDGSKMIKTMLMKADEELVIVLVRGDDQLNEVKLTNYLQATNLEPASEEEIVEVFGVKPGFIGPVNIEGYKILADHRIKNIRNAICGANIEDKHYGNISPVRDFDVDQYIDLRTVKAGDICPECEEGKLDIEPGIEVGHIFKLGTKYSESMGATYLDENGKAQLIVMGSYGIGITRIVAAAIEQGNDQNGIIWTKDLAPYEVIILPLGKSEEVDNTSEELYETLQEMGIEVLLDDRDERAGVKFNDADLIGIPIRITVGSRSLENNVLEVRNRQTGEDFEINIDNYEEEIKEMLSELE